MQRDNLIKIGAKKEVALTEEGLAKAERLARRHRLVEAFLCDTLGISWHEVHKHAHILEHGLTPLVEEKLEEFLNFPRRCPHGTPIPGTGNELPTDTVSLTDAKVGDCVEIVVVYEELEESVDLMKFLQDKNIIPGRRHTILEKTDITETMQLQFDTSSAIVPFDIARQIGVIILTKRQIGIAR